jgi:ribose transport system ATP-binding protein
VEGGSKEKLTPAPAALRVEGLTKVFGSTKALDDVSLEVAPGEIRGFVGQNGSGKSTLMRLLTGFYEPDGGRFLIDGSADSREGLAAIHQDLCLEQKMSIAENLGVAVNYGTDRWRPIRWRSENARARQELARLGIDCDPRSLIAEISPADRAAVAIARALRQLDEVGRRKLLIIDEATAYFSAREIGVIRDIVRKLAAEGCAVLYVTHNLREILSVCDSVSVLRNGRHTGTFSTGEIDESTLIGHMLGRSLESFYPDSISRPEADVAPRFVVKKLAGGRISDFSISIAPGELVGVTGLVGSGFEQIPYLLVGAQRSSGGEIAIDGRDARLTPVTAVEQGVSLVPADRARHGLWMNGNVTENYTITRLGQFTRAGFLDRRSRQRAARSAMADYEVQPQRPGLELRGFSGGNQQKVLLASRIHRGHTKVLLLHEPTQGVDSGAKRGILELIQATAREGTAVIVFSSDYEELANTCTRLLILSTEGRVASELVTAGLTEDDVVAACVAVG